VLSRCTARRAPQGASAAFIAVASLHCVFASPSPFPLGALLPTARARTIAGVVSGYRRGANAGRSADYSEACVEIARIAGEHFINSTMSDERISAVTSGCCAISGCLRLESSWSAWSLRSRRAWRSPIATADCIVDLPPAQAPSAEPSVERRPARSIATLSGLAGTNVVLRTPPGRATSRSTLHSSVHSTASINGDLIDVAATARVAEGSRASDAVAMPWCASARSRAQKRSDRRSRS